MGEIGVLTSQVSRAQAPGSISFTLANSIFGSGRFSSSGIGINISSSGFDDMVDSVMLVSRSVIKTGSCYLRFLLTHKHGPEVTLSLLWSEI